VNNADDAADDERQRDDHDGDPGEGPLDPQALAIWRWVAPPRKRPPNSREADFPDASTARVKRAAQRSTATPRKRMRTAPTIVRGTIGGWD
jgi:hypothetical protein